ncbi:MAG: S-layer homology domain-containing protein, partial [Chloroflexota bacterium]
DFALTTAGVTNAFVSSVSGSGTTYTVIMDTGTGDGSIRLDVVDNDSIRDGSSNPLGGLGTGNGNYTNGESYTIVKASFVDVPSTHMFWKYIEAFYQSGITTGCSQSPKMYCPLATVTRGEMAVFVERAMGNFAPTPNPTGMFTDLPYPGLEFFTPFIEEFYNDGITAGCAVNPLRYCPQNYVTRGEMAVFIERALGNFTPTPNPTGMFADVPYAGQPASFQAFIEEFYNDGITTGCAVNPLKYCPQNYVTRGEMAVFIVRAFGIPLP